MSARSFSRHYRQATGRTPARAVEDIRVEAVRRLLEQGFSLRQARIRCGFGSDETMRRSFLKTFERRRRPSAIISHKAAAANG